MTCPCGHYDYVDSTVETLATSMACMYDSQDSYPHYYVIVCFDLRNTDHRHHGNRIIHEKLTGNSLFPEISYKPNETE